MLLGFARRSIALEGSPLNIFRTAHALALLATLSIGIPRAETVTHYDEPGFSAGRDYLNQNFAENIDPFSGNLELHFTDLVIAGNGGFNLKIQRSYNRSRSGETLSPFGRGWDIHFGRVNHDTSQSCLAAPGQSMTLELPDGSLQTLHRSSGVAGTATTDYLTTGFWKGQCLANGIAIFAPDGTRYDMTEMDPGHWHASKITDRNGNYLTITYTSVFAVGRKVISQITASDGRVVNFTYSGQILSTISGAGRQWTYSIDASNFLNTVQPPLGSPWRFTYFNASQQFGANSLSSMTNPQGGAINYTYGQVNFLPGVAGYQPNTVIKTKTIGSDQWNFQYTPSCVTGLPNTSTLDQTVVTLPISVGGSITYRHTGYCNVTTNVDVWKIGLLGQKLIGALQTETYDWQGQVISNESEIRPGYNKSDLSIHRPLLGKRTISREGVTYTTDNGIFPGNFDAFGNPLSVTESGTRSRQRTGLTYLNDTAQWIVGFPENETISGVGTNTRTHFANGNLHTESRFGVTTTYTYYPDGALQSWASLDFSDT